jgi:hypothetical protein
VRSARSRNTCRRRWRVHPTSERDSPAEPSTSSESSTSSAPFGDDGLGPLVGTWSGEYTCAQGETGLTLAIEPIDDASVRVVLEFFPLPENPNVETGSFELIGGYSGDQLLFTQQKWLDQPPGYEMVDLEVTSPVEPDLDVLSGNVLLDGCKGFSARRD